MGIIYTLFNTFRVFCKIKKDDFNKLYALVYAQAIKMCLLLKYKIAIMPTVSFVSLGCASGTKNTVGIITTFDNANLKLPFTKSWNICNKNYLCSLWVVFNDNNFRKKLLDKICYELNTFFTKKRKLLRSVTGALPQCTSQGEQNPGWFGCLI